VRLRSEPELVQLGSFDFAQPKQASAVTTCD
jgi:hypothetical protein